MAAIESITLRHLDLPLVRPYRLSYRTFETYEPFLIEVRDDAGRYGFADGHISPGSSAETREGGWAFLEKWCAASIGTSPLDAAEAVLGDFEQSKVACTALVTALEVLQGCEQLNVTQTIRLPLLTPVNATEPDAIREEIEDWLEAGFRTFKVKVGKDVASDLVRVAHIQAVLAGRGTLRLDANRAYSRSEAIAFVKGLSADGVELFEQPCDADDWDANADVAAHCPVPLMLDEPICTLDDIARAAEIKNVGYCKLKLKRFGSIDRLVAGLDAVTAAGMNWVLGDGLGSDVHAWLEACAAQKTLSNAGEFNGFLKTRDRLLDDPLVFEAGAIVMHKGYSPRPAAAALERHSARTLTFTKNRSPIDAS